LKVERLKVERMRNEENFILFVVFDDIAVFDAFGGGTALQAVASAGFFFSISGVLNHAVVEAGLGLGDGLRCGGGGVHGGGRQEAGGKSRRVFLAFDVEEHFDVR
jgi:hypothetical protein